MITRENIDVDLIKNTAIEFAQHLQVKDNNRIIFSGKFGQGKTTFINEFFKPDNQAKYFGNEKEYNVIHLYPVNYSVSSNEDIFKYIKHDVIFELLNSDSSIQDDVISYLTTLPQYIGKNIHRILASFVGMIPQVGKDIVESFDRFDKLKEEYLKYHDQQEKKYNENAVLGDFIESVQNIDGSIYEDNVITKLIERILTRRKEIFKENVLVIDDLDRIDPEHIFRILNVFSAHFNYRTGRNKFGFDKVVLVCDIKNIRSIFKAKFGMNTDFNGYVDKFYSKRIFDFNNWNEIKRYVFNLVENASWSAKEGGNVMNNYKLKNARKSDGFIFEILSLLIENNQIQLRNVDSIKSTPFKYRTLININTATIKTDEINILHFINILVQLKGSPSNLKDAILECNLRYNFNDDYNPFILEMLNVLSIHATKYIDNSVDHNVNGKIIRFTKSGHNLSCFDIQNHQAKFTKEDFIYLFCKVIDLYETATDAH